MLEVCSGVTNEREKDGVYKRSGRLQPEGQRVTGTSLRARCSSMCLRLELGGSAVMRCRCRSKELWPLSIGPLVGGSASHFIDEGDGSIGERERVRMSLSLAAHADEDWIMVGTHNTVDVIVEC